MGYKRWRGNSGQSRYVEDPLPPMPPPPPPGGEIRPVPPPAPGRGRPPFSPGASFFRGLRLDREDLYLIGILWLLYRCSGERELLIAAAAYALAG